MTGFVGFCYEVSCDACSLLILRNHMEMFGVVQFIEVRGYHWFLGDLFYNMQKGWGQRLNAYYHCLWKNS